jgi:hypothetical protein
MQTQEDSQEPTRQPIGGICVWERLARVSSLACPIFGAIQFDTSHTASCTVLDADTSTCTKLFMTYTYSLNTMNATLLQRHAQKTVYSNPSAPLEGKAGHRKQLLHGPLDGHGGTGDVTCSMHNFCASPDRGQRGTR